MASLYITEFLLGSKQLPFPQLPPVAEQKVTIGGTSAQSAVLTGEVVQLEADAACSVKVGADPTAAATNMRIPANVPLYFCVSPGDKIAVITNS